MSVPLQLHRQTHITPLAVEETVPAADAADAAAVAMVLTLVFVIEQVADQTGVLVI